MLWVRPDRPLTPFFAVRAHANFRSVAYADVEAGCSRRLATANLSRCRATANYCWARTSSGKIRPTVAALDGIRCRDPKTGPAHPCWPIGPTPAWRRRQPSARGVLSLAWHCQLLHPAMLATDSGCSGFLLRQSGEIGTTYRGRAAGNSAGVTLM